jgi:SMI1/KNR4 family protein SUKH-1
MLPDTITRLDTMFAQFPIMRATTIPSEAEIAQAEQLVGVPFPDDYRQFLLRYGGAMVGPYPIFGLRPVEVMGVNHWSVVEVTHHYRIDRVPGTDQWAIISEDHAGHPIGLDRDGIVWIHDHDFDGTLQLYGRFEDYLRRDCLKLPV